MKLNGAFEPQQGASLIKGSSIGAKKYRDKQCESNGNDNNNNNNVALTGVLAIGYFSGSNNINTNSKVTEWIKSEKQQQLQQQQAKVTRCNSVSTSRDNLLHETSKLIKNYCNNSNSNYNNKNNNSKQINANSGAATEKSTIAKKAKATTTIASERTKAANNVIMNLLLGAVTILLSSFTNYKVSFNCTAWLKSYQVIEALLVRVQRTLLWVSTRARTLMATTKSPIANIASKTIRSRSHAPIPTLKLAALLCMSAVFMLLPGCAHCDEVTLPSFIPEIEEATTEFDYASRGNKKFGDKCEKTIECGFPGSICDPRLKSCQCTEDLPVTNHFDKCGKEAAVNESCWFNEQCEARYYETECRDNRCSCRFEMMPIWNKDGSVECKARRENNGTETYIDPAMIGVLVGMALMFIIICVVLRLFSQARWRENRTIFNTPNPRLMNVSLLRESKLVHGQERRGSRMSVRAPSRQPSMASLRPHSPNPSLGKSGSASNSHGSNASAASLRSTRSNSVAPGNIGNGQHERQPQPHSTLSPTTTTNITSNPVAESITVEIIEVKK